MELAALIHQHVGEDALYVVGVDSWVVSIAPGMDELSVGTIDATLSWVPADS